MTKKSIPLPPVTKNAYSPIPERKEKESDKNDNLNKKQDDFIRKGNGKQDEVLGDEGPVRLGFWLTANQRKALNKVQDKYPKSPGRKARKGISYQDYISKALSKMLKEDINKFGIEIDLPDDY